MIVNSRDIRHEMALEAARRIMTAATTAPKGKGVDDIESMLVDGEDLNRLADEMERLADGQPNASFVRDAGNIRASECAVVIGCMRKPLGLNCGHCGFPKCGGRPVGVPCAFNTVDLGIALGSACSMASECKVDTRVMFTAGLACMSLGWLKDCAPVFVLPISITAKSPYFDRNK